MCSSGRAPELCFTSVYGSSCPHSSPLWTNRSNFRYRTIRAKIYWLHGSQFFLRSWYFLSYSKKFPAFYEDQSFITVSQRPLAPIFLVTSHMNPIYALANDLIKLPFNIVLLSTCRSTKLSFSLTFPIQIHISVFCLFLTRTTFPIHLIILDLITQTIFGEEYISWSSSICSLLHSPVTSSLLDPNILLSTYSWMLSGYLFPSMLATKFHTHTKQDEVLEFFILIFMFWIVNWKIQDSALNDG